MDIAIVGAGLGGLAAGLCFARDGHRVQVFEHRATLSPKGSGLMIRPGASRILQSWGLGPAIERVGDIAAPVRIRDLLSGNPKSQSPANPSEHPNWGIRRPSLQDILYDHAIQAGCTIQFNATVEDVWDEGESRPHVRLRDGRVIAVDLVLVADGIRSRLRTKVLHDLANEASMDPIISDSVFYGVVVPLDAMETDPDAKPLMQQFEPTVWVDKHRYVVGRRMANSDTWVGLFGVHTMEHDSARMWDEEGDITYVREAFEGCCPELMAILKLATTCDRWKIAEMPDLPRWTSRRGGIVLLGDAAHAMQPNAAQGISQTIEDIGVLHAILTSASDQHISVITKLWQEMRKPRVDRIKAYALWNTHMFSGNKTSPVEKSPDPRYSWDSVQIVEPDATAAFNSPAFYKWAHDYDAVGEAHLHLQRYRSAKSML